MSQDYFMGQDMNYPDRVISSKVQAINNEIIKQRQELPQYRNPYKNNTQQHFQTAPQNMSTQRTSENRSSLHKSPNIQKIAPIKGAHAPVLASSSVLKNNTAYDRPFGQKIIGRSGQKAVTESYEGSVQGSVLYDSNYKQQMPAQSYAVVARHHAQSVTENFQKQDALEVATTVLSSSNNLRDNISKLHDQQRLQMHYMGQLTHRNLEIHNIHSRKAVKNNLKCKMKIRKKKPVQNQYMEIDSQEKVNLVGDQGTNLGDDEIVRHGDGGVNMPTSLGILRNVARQNRPNLQDLDTDYRRRAEGLLGLQSRHTQGAAARALKISSQGFAHMSPDQIQPHSSTLQKISYNPSPEQQIHRKGLKTVDQKFEHEDGTVDLDSQAASDINRFMRDQFDLSTIQRTPILKNDSKNYMKEFNDYQRGGSVFSSGNKHARQYQVKIVDDERKINNKYATPIIKQNGSFLHHQQHIIAESYDIVAGHPKKPVGFHQMSKTGIGFQDPSLGRRNDFSPHVYQNRGKFLNQKLPNINGQNSGRHMDNNTPKVLRNSQNIRLRALSKNTKQGSPTALEMNDSNYLMHGMPSVLPPYQLQSNKIRSGSENINVGVAHKQRTYEQIVKDLEKQFGFTNEENQVAIRQLKEEKVQRKKVKERKENDIIAKNKDFVKNLSECNNNIRATAGVSIAKHISQIKQPNNYDIINKNQKFSEGTNSKLQQKISSRGANNSKKKNKSPRTAKNSPRLRDKSQKNGRDSGLEVGPDSQVNILIPIDNGTSSRRLPARVHDQRLPEEQNASFQENMKLFARHESPSLNRSPQGSRVSSHGQSQDALVHSSMKSNRSPGIKSKRSGKSGFQSMEQGESPNQQSSQKHKPNNLYDFDPKFFHKKNSKPTLIQVQVNQEDLQHLKTDDIDDVSKLEVTYKILKEQLRHHQKMLIKKKEELKEKAEQGKVAEMKGKPLKQTIDLQKFAKHIKHFETYGSQRDVSPEIRRIVKNLMCQKHSFMYCPKCKTYDQLAVDPIENIQKFMRFVKDEQQKLRVEDAQKSAAKRKNRKHKGKDKPLPYDSASDITDLEEEGILNKYISDRMTDKQKKVKERKLIQERLYGAGNKIADHVCKSSQNRPSSEQPSMKMVKMELREIEDPVSMVDESNSAHQFSLQDHSVQADSEARHEIGMQTSAIEKQSQGYQYSRQDMESKGNQCSDVDYLSNHMNTSVYAPGCGREHMAIQTEVRRGTPKQVSKNVQTVRPKDDYKDDWEISWVYRKALKQEAEKRCIPYVDPVPEGENDAEDDDSTHDDPFKTKLNNSVQYRTREKHEEKLRKQIIEDQASQTETEQASSRQNDGSALCFLKSYKEKGNIKVLTESEIQYVKKLLKQKQHDYWTEKTTLVDLHRHCKYTIRKLTQQMANIDNYGVFKHLKDPTREHTLYLVYRAERLQAALADSQKIFKLLTVSIYDADEVERIVAEKSFSMEDINFLRKRVTMFKRILTQTNAFLETYKLFNNQFTFKKMALKEYVSNLSMQTQKALIQIEDLRQANPAKAAEEDERMKRYLNKKHEEYLARQIAIEEARKKVQECNQKEVEDEINSPTSQVFVVVNQDSSVEEHQQQNDLNQVFAQKRGSFKIAGQDEMRQLNNSIGEEYFVNRETIDLINQEVATSPLLNNTVSNENVLENLQDRGEEQ